MNSTSKFSQAGSIKAHIKPQSMNVNNSSKTMFENVFKNLQTSFECSFYPFKSFSCTLKFAEKSCDMPFDSVVCFPRPVVHFFCYFLYDTKSFANTSVNMSYNPTDTPDNSSRNSSEPTYDKKKKTTFWKNLKYLSFSNQNTTRLRSLV